LGVISILDLEDIGPEPLVTDLDIPREIAEEIVNAAVEESKRLAAQSKQNQAEGLLKKEKAISESETKNGDKVSP
jgi:hypothetical protein